MTPLERELSRIVRAIKRYTTFFIAGHVKPDGDTIGAGLALASLLKRLGKKPHVYSREEVPYYLKFLKGSDEIIVAHRVNQSFDCAIILECSELARMGSLITADQVRTVINIDHHRVSAKFGDINYIDSTASSSAEEVYRLFQRCGKRCTLSEAEALYTGMVTDTGKFQFSNTTAHCLEIAAELIRIGVAPEKMFRRVYEENKISSLRLLGYALRALKVRHSGQIAYIVMPNSMFRLAEADYSETENIINYAISVEGVRVGILFRETEDPHMIKASLRSRGNIDVSAIAKRFGGGGHKNAAGLSLRGSMAQAKKKLFHVVERFLS